MKWTVRPSVLLAGVALVAGCTGTELTGVQTGCREGDDCACVAKEDCGAGWDCVDGRCVFEPGSAGDAHGDTGEPDGSAANDTAETDGDAETYTPEPGELLWPCTSDGDCNSNKCIALEGSATDVCTRDCVDECPLDWLCRGVSGPGGVLFYCLPPDSRLCDACVSDFGCPGDANLCAPVGGGFHCGVACEDDGQCPEGYGCAEVTSIDGQAGRQCQPLSGHCLCTAETVGVAVACERSNVHGVCYGKQICGEGGTLGPCDARVPAAEVCDGEDNDCDGFADDDVAPTPCEKEGEAGVCTGQSICTAGAVLRCTAAEPAAESCDLLDNDCDGETDEEFLLDGVYATFESCGACGRSCAGLFAHAGEVVCDPSEGEPRCRVATCEPGYVLTAAGVCLPPVDHLCEPCTADAQCGGVGDRCVKPSAHDGQTFCARDCGPDNRYDAPCPAGYACEEREIDGATVSLCLPANGSCDCLASNAGQIKPCADTNEWGTCYGVATCDPEAGWVGCTAGTAASETCNGQDDDCDGIIDEGWGGGPCVATNEHGTCAGVEVCDGAAGLRCTAEQAAPEVCDGLDNDCDGETDEGFAAQLTDRGGAVVGLRYDISDQHCGGCGLACVPAYPATEVHCDGGGEVPTCKAAACAPGFYVGEGGAACLPIPSGNLCLPCEGDADCRGPADRCLPYAGSEGGARCGRDCSEGSIYSAGAPGDPGYCDGAPGVRGCCPSGYLCGADGQCASESGDCDCDVTGKLRPCVSHNAHGSCAGTQICVASGPGAGWQACDAPTPEAEVCDGADNDCDGLVDQFDPSVDTADLPGYPACDGGSEHCVGTWFCGLDAGGSYAWLCSARQPAAETCNGLDDDCDGLIDEDFAGPDGSWLSLEHCGRCGLECASALANLADEPDAVACELSSDGLPTCVPRACAPGFALFPSTQEPAVCLEVEGPGCRPCSSDADCGTYGDPCVEVGDDEGRYCAQRCDADAVYEGCTGETGVRGCCPAGFLCQEAAGGGRLCVPESGSCQCREASAGLVRACSAAAGDATCFGTSTCAGVGEGGGLFAWSACDLSANVEVCDEVDNDCDGETDEGFRTDGVYRDDANCGQCGKSCALAYSAENQHVFGVCDADAPGGPACTIGGCLEEAFGGGTPCTDDADCAFDQAGESCLPRLQQCGRRCAGDADCPAGGVCTAGGSCSIHCAGDAECAAAFGAGSTCADGACVTLYRWQDLDGLEGDGCECPVALGSPGDVPETFAYFPTATARYVDRDCDGIDGDAERALFVSAQADAGGDGSREAPFATIGQAIEAFDPALHDHVLVATGIYEERIVLRSGVNVHGGYSLDFGHRNIVLYPTVIAAPEPDWQGPEAPGTVFADGIEAPTTLAGFVIRGYDATSAAGAGRPSYAVYLRASSAALRIVDNRIQGGQGGAGDDGQAGLLGQGGGAGGAGHDAAECSDATCSGGQSLAGGAAGQNAGCAPALGCPGMESETEDPQQADSPPAGCTYENGGTRATYSGSADVYCKYDCTIPGGYQNGPSGDGGASGEDAGGGLGCSEAYGSVLGGVWVGDAGSAGSAGGPGGGGGGGSAGGWVRNDKSATLCDSATTGDPVGDLGGSGGGGGAGGCGGSGGLPGQTGGASFAVFIASAPGGVGPTVAGNVITRGPGGAGGAGGNGGSGGKGGAGGTGGKSRWPAWCAGEGGSGGRGGDGGAGGGGGGGCGGPSYGLAAVGLATFAYQLANTFTSSSATGGAAGPGGSSLLPGSTGTPGAPGPSGDTVVY